MKIIFVCLGGKKVFESSAEAEKFFNEATIEDKALFYVHEGKILQKKISSLKRKSMLFDLLFSPYSKENFYNPDVRMFLENRTDDFIPCTLNQQAKYATPVNSFDNGISYSLSVNIDKYLVSKEDIGRGIRFHYDFGEYHIVGVAKRDLTVRFNDIFFYPDRDKDSVEPIPLQGWDNITLSFETRIDMLKRRCHRTKEYIECGISAGIDIKDIKPLSYSSEIEIFKDGNWERVKIDKLYETVNKGKLGQQIDSLIGECGEAALAQNTPQMSPI